jgi:hypothetical protein
MGARYLKTEDDAIVKYYPTASRDKILKLIPDRTWEQIGVHARGMRILRTSKAWGNSIREGRKALSNSWQDCENILFDELYPTALHSQLILAFPDRTWHALQSHAQKRHLHRTREAAGRQINIGRRNAKEQKEICD